MKAKLTLLMCVCALLPLVGCEEEPAIVTYNAPKEPPPPPLKDIPDGPKWTLPGGWARVAPTDPMQTARVATGTEGVSMTVTQLPARSGLAENVNRWERQLNLPISSEDQAKKQASEIKVDGATVHVVDLEGPQRSDGPQLRTLGALAMHHDLWAFKIMGPAEKVGKEKANFEAFLKSLKFELHDHDHGDGEAAAGAQAAPPTPRPEAAAASPASAQQGGAGGATWALPAGWKQDTANRPMRLATILAGEGGAEVIVSRFPATVAGDVLANLNRWRAEVRLPPTNDANENKPQDRQIGGRSGKVYDFTGSGANPLASRVVAITSGNELWYFKLRGPAEAVNAQKAAFDQLLSSIRFESK